MKTIILSFSLFFANCATFDDSVAEAHKQCVTMFRNLKIKDDSYRNKIAYADCVSRMATGYEVYRSWFRRLF